jgi:hypothetical protein
MVICLFFTSASYSVHILVPPPPKLVINSAELQVKIKEAENYSSDLNYGLITTRTSRQGIDGLILLVE